MELGSSRISLISTGSSRYNKPEMMNGFSTAIISIAATLEI
jgi:hypothetical protein